MADSSKHIIKYYEQKYLILTGYYQIVFVAQIWRAISISD